MKESPIDLHRLKMSQQSVHESGFTHVSGESIFVDDIRPQKDELQVGYLGSPVANGTLKKVDVSQALKIPGVVGILTAKDIEHNLWGPILKDQPLLISDRIGYRDEPICIIAAETKKAIELAKLAIVLKIKEARPVLSLTEAIKNKAYLYVPLAFQKGDVELVFQKAPHILKGSFEIGGQEHFYLESQAAIAYPLDGNQMKVISSTQHPTETQHLVAEAIGVPFHQVICEARRMGGAFGGKESQAAPFAGMAAVVAHRFKRSARIAISKDDDMKVTGKRHPFLNFYEVAYDDDGKILGLKVKLFADGGAYTDLSPSILDRSMFHADGAYYLENALIEAWVCKTNNHSNTAFRGFGGPQGNITIENIIEDISKELNKDAAEIRVLNCYQKNDRNITPYGQKVEDNLLPELFEKLLRDSDYKTRRKEINAFNGTSKSRLKGLALTACKFGISFTSKFLNQGNALVHVHRDGTIQASTGATEMGQGVNTKIAQIIAYEFGLTPEKVQILATSTDKNANTSPTAASSGFDINGAAALLACEKIKFRMAQVAKCFLSQNPRPPIAPPLEEIKITELNPAEEFHSFEVEFKDEKVTYKGQSMSWIDLILLTYYNRISISDYSHFKTRDLTFDRARSLGDAFKYFTSGVAVSEVVIDTYTGETKILRCDILMDIGRPVNIGIDMGQVTGGFVQGAGWMTTEKLFYSKDGALISHSPTTYKIPNIQDTPRIFNVNLLENNLNKKSVSRAKAVGEPPLLLSASVFMAIKNAISYRTKKQLVDLKVPATPETILLELTRHEL